MKTKFWAIGLVLLCTIFTTTAQYFWKNATNQNSIQGILFSHYLWIGFVFYGLSAVLLIVALKGGELSVLYPIIATSFIWVTLISAYLIHETVGFNKWIGVFSIIVGITFLGVGSK
jgi:uncharacterized membrane protein